MRFTRTFVAGLLVVGLVGSLCGCTPPEDEPAVEGAPTAVVVTVEGDVQPTVEVADLGEAERDGIEGIAGLAGEGGIAFGTPIDIELEGEMPAGGATLTRVYAAPLPEGTAATFAYWDEEGETWAAVPTILNEDRTTITATVTHFSTWLDVVAANTQTTLNNVVNAASAAGQAVATWTGQAVTKAAEATLWSLGNIASVRVELPECDVPTPNWVTSETLQDDPTHPVRLCVGHDAQNPDLLVVKARSNRAYGFSVDLTVAPAWQYNATAENNLSTVISTIGGVDASIGQSVAELLNNGRFVGGGKEISFGLPESSFRDYSSDHLLKLAPPSMLQFVFSMLAQELFAAGISEVDGYLGAAITLSSCLDSGLNITDVGNLSSFMATCLTSVADQGANILTNALVKKGYAEVPALKTAKKILGRATLTFALFSGGAAAADYALENVAYSDADRTVQVTVADGNVATQAIDLNPFSPDGVLQPGWTVDNARVSDPPIECGGATYAPIPSMAGVTPNTFWCGGTADSAYACWAPPTYPGQLLCVNDPTLGVLRAVAADGISSTPAADDPQPLYLELDDGSQWMVRSGGSWSGRDDGYVGAYSCQTNCASNDDVVLVKDGNPVDRSTDTWTVLVGQLGEGQAWPAPQSHSVAKAWFIASSMPVP